MDASLVFMRLFVKPITIIDTGDVVRSSISIVSLYKHYFENASQLYKINIISYFLPFF